MQFIQWLTGGEDTVYEDEFGKRGSISLAAVNEGGGDAMALRVEEGYLDLVRLFTCHDGEGYPTTSNETVCGCVCVCVCVCVRERERERERENTDTPARFDSSIRFDAHPPALSLSFVEALPPSLPLSGYR